MCVIIHLPRNATFPWDYLQNATWNNWHGYGLVVQKGKELEVFKKMPEGEEGINPEDVRDILDKHKKYDRYLHLRHRTEGDLSIANVQPFCIYDDENNEVHFMHNGTLHDYKPVEVNGTKDFRSDSRIFADCILRPFLAEVSGNYASPIAQKIIQKFWPFGSSNRGLILSRKYTSMYINPTDWKILKVSDEHGVVTEFKCSNDEYFYSLKRGPEFERRVAEEKAKQAENTFCQDNKNDAKTWPLTKLKDVSFKANEYMGKELEDILCDFELHTDEGLAQLENLTEKEIIDFNVANPIIGAALIVILTSVVGRLHEEVEELTEKHDKATKRIATMMNGNEIIDAEIIAINGVRCG